MVATAVWTSAGATKRWDASPARLTAAELASPLLLSDRPALARGSGLPLLLFATLLFALSVDFPPFVLLVVSDFPTCGSALFGVALLSDCPLTTGLSTASLAVFPLAGAS